MMVIHLLKRIINSLRQTVITGLYNTSLSVLFYTADLMCGVRGEHQEQCASLTRITHKKMTTHVLQPTTVKRHFCTDAILNLSATGFNHLSQATCPHTGFTRDELTEYEKCTLHYALLVFDCYETLCIQ